MTQRYLHDLEHGKGKGWPRSPETFSAIAEALETTPLAVVLGFAVEFGVPVRMPTFATRLPPAIDSTPERVQDAIVDLAWAVSTEAPVRRYMSDDAIPDVTGWGDLIADTDTDSSWRAGEG